MLGLAITGRGQANGPVLWLFYSILFSNSKTDRLTTGRQ